MKKAGGFAFPGMNNMGDEECGMLLRDYFAGQMLAGYFAHPERKPISNVEDFGKAIYKIADGVIAVRNCSEKPE